MKRISIKRILKRYTWLLLSLALLVGSGLLMREVPVTSAWIIHWPEPETPADADKITMQRLERDVQALHIRLDRLIPNGTYLVVNTTENSFRLYRNKKLVREGICSTGSSIQLEHGPDKKWVFKTPKGMFSIQGKTVAPVWRKPDWAFVEDGLPVPPPNHPSRYEAGVLGEYALSLGQGYLIHGTLYKRFLGLPVTHGCIRMNDEDLEVVYHTLAVGSKVFIY